MSSLTDSFKNKPVMWAFIIIIFSTFARLWFLGTGQLNLVQDEAQYWDWTRHMQLTYYSKGPLIAWIISTSTSIFGNTEFGVRFGSIVGSFLTQVVLFWGMSKLWKRPGAAIWTLIIYNSMPVFLALGILMTTDNPFILCWTCAVFALYEATVPHPPGLDRDSNESRSKPFFFITFFLALGILAKYTMLGFTGLAVIYALVLMRKERLPRGFWRKLLLSLGGGVFIGFLPTLIWNLQNDFVGYKHVFYLIGASGDKASHLIRLDRVLPYLGEQIGMATPWWLVFMLIGGFGALAVVLKKKARNKLDLNNKQSALLSVFFLPAWFFFLLWSFHAKVHGNWAVISYVSGVMIAGFSFEYFWTRKGRFRYLWMFLSIFIFVVLHFQNLVPLPDNLNPTHRLKGWNDLGQQVVELEKTQFKDPSKVFIMSEQYDMTAALAFYVPGQPRTYCAWIDRRMNQYDLWPGPEGKEGWDSIYVLKKYKEAPDDELKKMFKRISPPIHIQTTFRGKPARKFTIYLCYDYNGYWPKDERLRF
ncbi:ArnT family glycosyltransferase [Maridesulfovibrio hydrothermalis]|uniref:Glycosyl transferase family 39 n=1 Tax=Maridesulfovibrio hydrothermalis AM13 = DSM 14728 TaxID=1121451 RepID=L0R9V9_9BACT|nr:glycosyltransferase family 39 protein [Maridesulfovibrio hydrothermalis]CCO22960.1 Glycosyl transferase family 39 [Maridesulfovibrio hydrothermalis AM13 = DSM 14728]